MAKKRARAGRARAPATAPPRRLVEELDEAEALLGRKRYVEARELLEDLDDRFPNRPEVLTSLVNSNAGLHDLPGYLRACERLVRLDPDNADATLGLAGAYLSNLYPMLGLRTFRRFLTRWPDHARAGDARETVADLEGKIPEFLASIGESGEEGVEIATRHEEVRMLLEQGHFAQARRAAEELLRRRPTLAPALNNISQTYALEGRFDRAIATAERVLAFAPDNYQALSNITRYYCLSGRADEAREWAARLKAVAVPDVVDIWVKQAEAFSYLGDDEGVLDAFHGAERAGDLNLTDGALLCHLAAVAAMRQGREDEARKLWRRALKERAGFALARDNLDDLRLPVGERNAPWPFSFANWVTRRAIEDLAAQVEPATQSGQDDAIERAIRRHLRQHPEVAALAPLLLDRGDPQGREFAFFVATTVRTPELLAALRDFALGQRGPDALRHQAAQAASEGGLLPDKTLRLWLQGEWREVTLLGFEIYDEPTAAHGPEVEAWLIEATTALRARETARAEDLLQRALAVEPDAPDLLNNLAVAHEQRGRPAEAEALLREIHARHPDYGFAPISLARMQIQRGELDDARALLAPLLARTRIHIDEFGQLCATEVELALADRNRAAARTWLDLWAGADPENPALATWRLRVGAAGRRPFGRRR
ncbi:MAG TPA: tetratricopeptide repeat protein [Thermomicrobiales bacterium]|nr:tetratricopeptide repeat protein [Thermomicrobiales bacterium]